MSQEVEPGKPIAILQNLRDALTMNAADSNASRHPMNVFPESDIAEPVANSKQSQALIQHHSDKQDMPDQREMIFFKVINTAPSRRRLMPLSVGAAGSGGRLMPEDIAVVQFAQEHAFDSWRSDGACFISLSPSADSSAPDSKCTGLQIVRYCLLCDFR